jgi:ABC-2 type transport system ATP-binding protein
VAALVETKDLSKRYTSLVALDHLNLNIPEGAVFGFIGPNGAGKTTTMRILTTLLTPSGGEAWVAGHAVSREPKMVRRLVGWMPDAFGVYDNMQCWEYLDFFAASYEVPAERRKRLVGELLEIVDLGHKYNENVMGLSRGMKQRLSLARAMVHDPKLLILDEPASGLDPRARIELRELLKELRSMGKTIMISSHILSELAEMCTHIGIIEAGKLLAAGEVDEIMHGLQPHRTIEIHVLHAADEAMDLLRALPGVRDVRGQWEPGTAPPASSNGAVPADAGAPSGETLTETLDVAPVALTAVAQRVVLLVDYLGDEAGLGALLQRLIVAGVPVVHFAAQASDLEDIFMRVTQGVTQ